MGLNPGLSAGVTVKHRAGWGDPLLTGRYHYNRDALTEALSTRFADEDGTS